MKTATMLFKRRYAVAFRDLKDKEKKIILAEGDSWFNYPIILTDIIDRIRMEKNFALYQSGSRRRLVPQYANG